MFQELAKTSPDASARLNVRLPGEPEDFDTRRHLSSAKEMTRDPSHEHRTDCSTTTADSKGQVDPQHFCAGGHSSGRSTGQNCLVSNTSLVLAIAVLKGHGSLAAQGGSHRQFRQCAKKLRTECGLGGKFVRSGDGPSKAQPHTGWSFVRRAPFHRFA